MDFSVLQGIAALQRPNKPSLLGRVVTLFGSESPKCIVQIVDGVAAADLDAIRVGAHTLKSSSANVGASSLSERCRLIENAARENNLEACTELAEELTAEFDASLAKIQEHVEQAA